MIEPCTVLENRLLAIAVIVIDLSVTNYIVIAQW